MNSFFSYDNYEVHCHEFHSSQFLPTVILLHGFMEDSEIWYNIIPEINANVFVIDLPGFGKSKLAQSIDYSLKDIGRLIHEFIHEKIQREVYILGHSMGGYVALEAMTNQSNLLKGICLLHSTPYADTSEKKENRNKTIQVLEVNSEIFIREFYWNLFAEHRKHEFEKEIQYLKTKATLIPIAHIINTTKALRDRRDLHEVWFSSNLHHKIILGRHDKLIPCDILIQAHNGTAIPTSILENAGHMGFLEEPSQLIKEINDWIK